jgi:hypothetical protein
MILTLAVLCIALAVTRTAAAAPQIDVADHADRQPAHPPEPRASAAWNTKCTVLHSCFACHRMAPLYVYPGNGNHYGLRCTAENYSNAGLRPAGRWDGDMTSRG